MNHRKVMRIKSINIKITVRTKDVQGSNGYSTYWRMWKYSRKTPPAASVQRDFIIINFIDRKFLMFINRIKPELIPRFYYYLNYLRRGFRIKNYRTGGNQTLTENTDATKKTTGKKNTRFCVFESRMIGGCHVRFNKAFICRNVGSFQWRKCKRDLL